MSTIDHLAGSSKTHAIIFYEPPEATAGPADDDGGWGAAYVDRDAEEAPLASTSPDAKVEPRGTWAIVDLGSTHGTFFKRPAEGGSSKGKGERLSEPKVASLPRVLEHGDEVRVGGTTFKVRRRRRPAPSLSSAQLQSASLTWGF